MIKEPCLKKFYFIWLLLMKIKEPRLFQKFSNMDNNI